MRCAGMAQGTADAVGSLHGSANPQHRAPTGAAKGAPQGSRPSGRRRGNGGGGSVGGDEGGGGAVGGGGVQRPTVVVAHTASGLEEGATGNGWKDRNRYRYHHIGLWTMFAQYTACSTGAGSPPCALWGVWSCLFVVVCLASLRRPASNRPTTLKMGLPFRRGQQLVQRARVAFSRHGGGSSSGGVDVSGDGGGRISIGGGGGNSAIGSIRAVGGDSVILGGGVSGSVSNVCLSVGGRAHGPSTGC